MFVNIVTDVIENKCCKQKELMFRLIMNINNVVGTFAMKCCLVVANIKNV